MTAADRDDAGHEVGSCSPTSARSYERRSARELQIMALEDAWQRMGSDCGRRRGHRLDGWPLRITFVVNPMTIVVRVGGDLDYWTGPLLPRTVARRADATSEVVLDLTQVGFLDGGGVRSLLAVRAQVGPERFRIGACSPTVQRLLTLVRLTELISVGGAPAA